MAIEKDDFYRQLGRRVAAARSAKHRTQESLAEVLGLSRTSVTNLEAGRQPIQVHVLVALAQALGTTAQELLPTEEQGPVPQSATTGVAARHREWVQRILTKDRTTGKE